MVTIHWPAQGNMPVCTVHADPEPRDAASLLDQIKAAHLAMIGDPECREAYRRTAVIVCDDNDSAAQVLRLAVEYGHGGVH